MRNKVPRKLILLLCRIQLYTEIRRKNTDEESLSVVSSDDDPFGNILHPTIIDEDSDDEDRATEISESEADEFDQLLQYQESEEDDSTLLQPSVSTVLQDRPRFSMGSAASGMSDASTATVLQRRRLMPDSLSALSSDTASCLPSLLVQDNENSVPNRNSMPKKPDYVKKQQGSLLLPFRETNRAVKPNEQKPSLEARKWRALAAAAHEKSLCVRHPNL